MALFKVFSLALCLAVAYAAPQAIKEEEEFAPAFYNFGFTVADEETGDVMTTRQESRDGDIVKGSYTVLDADNRLRLVEYTASKEGGFQAKVTYNGEVGPVAIPLTKDGETFIPEPAPVIPTVSAIPAPAPAVVRTVAAAPTVVRTVAAAPTVVRTVAAPTVVRTVPAPAAVHTTLHHAQPVFRPVATPFAAFHAPTHFVHA